MRALELQLVACMAVAGAPLLSQTQPPELPEPAHSVLLLGSFHFSDAGLDEYKPQFDVDIKSARRQAELEKVLAVLDRYRPTKIAVEVRPDRQADLDGRYEKYLAGGFELPANEVYQLGFRLAARLGHRRVFAIDAERRFYEPWVDPDEYAKEHGQADAVSSPWYGHFRRIHAFEDRLKTEETLLQTLLRLNHPERVRRSHGIYLIGTFRSGVGDDYPGVDSKTAWYNRNLRIFANVQRITEQPTERILVVIGTGHLPILRHCVEASPEYELVELASLADDSPQSAAALDVAALLEKNTYELGRDGSLSGSGWDFLLDETEDAQFVLLGEVHNTDQVNHFTARLFEQLHREREFEHLVTEQDAFVMELFSSEGIRGDLEAVRSEAAKHPEALHFETDEELALLARVGAISDAAKPIWGVDRVHDAVLALTALLQEAESDSDRRQIGRLLEEERVKREENGKNRSFVTREDETLDALLRDLHVPAGSRAAEIVHALRESRENFRAYQVDHEPGEPWGYRANQQREELMKSRLIAHYRRAVASGEETPKAVVKMGHWHVRRGHNDGNVPTLGSFLVDLARFNGMGAPSINLQPVNVPGRHWSIADYPEYAALTATADPEKWLVVDLRPLRGYVHSGALRVTPEVETTVFGYDFLMLIGGTDRGKVTWK